MEITTDSLIALLTLTSMEIVLGIDNIIFISILVAKLPAHQQESARKLGIGLALGLRLALLFSISWVMGLTEPLFAVVGKEFSGRDMILLLGGLFLIAKATFEIHEKLESGPSEMLGAVGSAGAGAQFGKILFQILLLDVVFSLDSVITAVGMAGEIWIMVVAMIVAVVVMLISARPIGGFVHKHPTIKILALSFLLLIGVMLLVEGMGSHVNKGYIYFAMAFSFGVELLNMRYRKVRKPVELLEPQSPQN
jgi:predicted tellurium resistance membrane protein TerC